MNINLNEWIDGMNQVDISEYVNLNEWIDGMNQVDISEYVNEERRLRPSQDDFSHFRGYYDTHDKHDIYWYRRSTILQPGKDTRFYRQADIVRDVECSVPYSVEYNGVTVQNDKYYLNGVAILPYCDIRIVSESSKPETISYDVGHVLNLSELKRLKNASITYNGHTYERGSLKR